MHLDQLRKAVSDSAELEYLSDGGQWVPASMANFQDSNSGSPHITIQLLSHPAGHFGIIPFSTDDVEHRLRVRGSN